MFDSYFCEGGYEFGRIVVDEWNYRVDSAGYLYALFDKRLYRFQALTWVWCVWFEFLGFFRVFCSYG